MDKIIDYVVNCDIYISVKTVHSVGKEGATEGMCCIVLAACIVTNDSFIRPFKLVTLVGEDRVGFGAICYEDALESVHLHL